MKRRILLVDDEIAILLTLKAVLEIHGFDVETATSAREARSRLRKHEYHMVITDMRMESAAAGLEVVKAAKSAPYQPAVAMLTAYPFADAEWQQTGMDKMLVKPMNATDLVRQIEALLISHEDKKNHSQQAETGSKPAKRPAGKAASQSMAKPAVATGSSD